MSPGVSSGPTVKSRLLWSGHGPGNRSSRGTAIFIASLRVSKYNDNVKLHVKSEGQHGRSTALESQVGRLWLPQLT